MAEVITGKVIKVIDENKIVINKGLDDGITMENKFLVYRLGPEMTDPDTGESLGNLELVCGEGKPEHIQKKMTTLITAKIEVKKPKTVIKRGGLNPFYGDTEEIYEPETYIIPFEDVGEDCSIRQIK